MKTGTTKRRGGLAGLLALVMLLSLLLAACGGSGGARAAAGGNDITGTYVASYEMRDLLNTELASSGIALESEVNVDFLLELKDDNTFSFEVDPDSLVSSLTGALTADLDSIIGSLMGMELTDDMKESVAQMGGYESYDAMKEALMESMQEELDEDALSEMMEECHFDGNYTVSGSDLKLVGKTDGAIAIDSGTIQEDGSIHVESEYEGTNIEVTFVKK